MPNIPQPNLPTDEHFAFLTREMSYASVRLLWPLTLIVGILLGFGLGLALGSITDAFYYYVAKETFMGLLGGVTAPAFLILVRRAHFLIRHRDSVTRPTSYMLYYAAGALAGALMAAATLVLPARIPPGFWLIFYPFGTAGVFPLLGLIADYIQEQRSENQRTKEIFSRYVSESIARRILSTRQPIPLEGEKRQTTVLISDIRGFTRMIKELGAAEVVRTLNEYFAHMIDIIFDYDGTVNKFIGDAIVVLYGVPLTLGNETTRAIETARAMMREVRRMNVARAAQTLPPLRIGIAIDAGEVICGNIGSPRRLEYTAIGTPVNTAYLLAGLAPAETIYITESVYQAAAPRVAVRGTAHITLKSGAGELTVYILDDEGGNS